MTRQGQMTSQQKLQKKNLSQLQQKNLNYPKQSPNKMTLNLFSDCSFLKKEKPKKNGKRENLQKKSSFLKKKKNFITRR